MCGFIVIIDSSTLSPTAQAPDFPRESRENFYNSLESILAVERDEITLRSQPQQHHSVSSRSSPESVGFRFLSAAHHCGYKSTLKASEKIDVGYLRLWKIPIKWLINNNKTVSGTVFGLSFVVCAGSRHIILDYSRIYSNGLTIFTRKTSSYDDLKM